jgi:hypothetical protein
VQHARLPHAVFSGSYTKRAVNVTVSFKALLLAVTALSLSLRSPPFSPKAVGNCSQFRKINFVILHSSCRVDVYSLLKALINTSNKNSKLLNPLTPITCNWQFHKILTYFLKLTLYIHSWVTYTISHCVCRGIDTFQKLLFPEQCLLYPFITRNHKFCQ